jgi:hypothetical protein
MILPVRSNQKIDSPKVFWSSRGFLGLIIFDQKRHLLQASSVNTYSQMVRIYPDDVAQTGEIGIGVQIDSATLSYAQLSVELFGLKSNYSIFAWILLAGLSADGLLPPWKSSGNDER